MNIEKMYEENDAFRQYVDKYCTKHEIGPKTAFTHAMIKIIADYYREAEKGKISVSEVNAGCGGASAKMGVEE